jgi:integrase
MARRWIKRWGELMCSEISPAAVQKHLIQRRKVSAYTANQDLRYLRATFNYGVKKKLISSNPTEGLEFFPVVKRKKYVPDKDDVLKVINTANSETQQYLWTIVLTAARVSEVNQLTWDDVDFGKKVVTLWTRKRKGGNRESREVPMIQKLYDILRSRHQSRSADVPWVFWHTYWSRKSAQWVKRPYKDRKNLMTKLCNDAGVRYFRYHAFRHLTASILDDLGVSIGVIQRILGHQNRKTTEIYLHSIGDAEREAMKRLEESDFFKADVKPDPDAPTNMPMAFWNRKVERPSYEVLKGEVARLGFAATGRKYGVSDNAVRKWLKSYEREKQCLAN